MWDVFLCYAIEDQQDIAKPLTEALKQAGLKSGECILAPGDSLHQAIKRNLTHATCGLVLLSPHVFENHRNRDDLEIPHIEKMGSGKVVLPLWHNVTHEYVERFSPTLAERKAISTSEGLDVAVQQIIGVFSALDRRGQIFEFETVTVNASGSIIQREQYTARQRIEELGPGVLLEMAYIPGEKFQMGSSDEEQGHQKSEYPQHEVMVLPFYMGKFPVTQEQWEIIMGTNPSEFKRAQRPVEMVSWDDAVEFCERLSEKTGRFYRLPSEAEWEYACRAGTTTPFSFGETITTDLANYNGSMTYASEPEGVSLGYTTNVGSFPPNAFGLYDMHGNVREWCTDFWHDNYQRAPSDNRVWKAEGNPKLRVLRGGSWLFNPFGCRSACRSWRFPLFGNPGIGFRVVCGIPK